MRFPLDRILSNAVQTVGLLTVGRKSLFTMEPPWLHNYPGLSCIPAGS